MELLFDRYRPQSAWFHNPMGIHGPSHAARVLVRANEIAEALMRQGAVVDLEVVRWAAALHDVGRINDGQDPQHGHRSAVWFLENVGIVAPHLTDLQRQKVVWCCAWHVPPDSEAPQMPPDLMCLKDADGLDRIRLGEGGLDPRMLRTEHARRMVGTARELVAATLCDGWADGWERVRGAALWRGEWR